MHRRYGCLCLSSSRAGILHRDHLSTGKKLIQYLCDGTTSAIDVPEVNAVDTIQEPPTAFLSHPAEQPVLAAAAKVATYLCLTRRWMEDGKETAEMQ